MQTYTYTDTDALTHIPTSTFVVTSTIRTHARYCHSPSYPSFLQDTIGFNLAGLRYLKRELESRDVKFFADVTAQSSALKDGQKKRRKVVKSG